MRAMCVPSALLLAALASVSACVPADEALPLGAAQFTITARGSARDLRIDAFDVRIDRFLIAFKTMTIVNLQNSDQCAYRGQGTRSNVLFDGTEGSVVQSFNGIKPGSCPDVGLRLAPPDDRTVLGDGATVEDLISFATGTPAIAQLEATAIPDTVLVPEEAPMRISLRFDVLRTASAFGGCRDAIRGAKLTVGARYASFVEFSARVFFSDQAFANGFLRLAPFLRADRLGNNDKTITMDELDALPLSLTGYEMPPDASAAPGTRRSFGDYVRFQFQFAVKFGDGGICNGIPAGTKLDE